ncbi:MAG TPA: DUF455 family protein [Gaiellaceae bacterium]|nr:DUF455 family protein [Gaiellaceae bacterium]
MSRTVKDFRRIGPETWHDVPTNATGLGVLYTLEVELARLLGGWIARMPELSEKIAFAKVVYEDAEHAALLEARLLELRVAEPDVALLRRRTASTLTRLERADDPWQVLAAVFRVVKPALLADLRRHLEGCPPYVDEPTVRILRRIIAEEEQHLELGLALLAARGVAWGGPPPGALWDLDAADGGLIQGDFVGAAPVDVPSPVWPAVVERLAYDDPMPPYPEDFETAMQRCVHELVFSETEAIDIFGRYVYEFPDLPWQFSLEAARICWDEARHVELLLDVLDRWGGHVGQFPAKAPGYEEFAREAGTLERIIMINVIAEGEVSTDTQTQHRDAFRELGDELSALLKDYEMADEVFHGQFGVKWSRLLAAQTGQDYEAAYAHAKASLEDFKAQHDEEGVASPIPLVRLGAEEMGSGRVVNVGAKRLLGFTDEEIERLAAASRGTVED